jgi:5-methylcytosine-specific restriction endonuclease McrA
MYTEEEDISTKPKSGRQLFANWKKSTEGQFLIKQMIDQQLGMCPSCFTHLGSTYMVDHIFPIAKLTPDTMWMATHHSNLIVLCPSCNLKKKDKVYMIKQAGDIPRIGIDQPMAEPKKTRKKIAKKQET